MLFLSLRLTTSTVVRSVLRNAHRHMEDGRFPSSPSSGNILGKMLCSTLGGIRGKGQIRQWSWGLELSQSGMSIRSPPGASPPIWMVESGGMNKVPVLVKDRLSPTREGKLQWKVCLHPHLKQGGMPPVERSYGCGCCFFLSYRWELTVPEPLL